MLYGGTVFESLREEGFMQFRMLFERPLARLWLRALFLQGTTLIGVVFRRRRRGIMGIVCFPFRISLYLALSVIAYLCYGWRAGVAFSFLAWFRRIDDAVDSCVPVPWRTAYLERKRDAIHCLTATHHRNWEADDEDALIVHAVRASSARRINLIHEAEGLYLAIAIDVGLRRGSFPSDRALWEIASRQDACVLGAMVKIFGGDECRLARFLEAHAGIFSRIDWIADMPEDLRQGIIRISDTLAEIYEIDVACLRETDESKLFAHRSIATWRMSEAQALRRRWLAVRRELGSDFGSMFTSKLTSRLFHVLIVREFERTLGRVIVKGI